MGVLWSCYICSDCHHIALCYNHLVTVFVLLLVWLIGGLHEFLWEPLHSIGYSGSAMSNVLIFLGD